MSSPEEFFDGREMTMVHRVFRRELRLAPGLLRAVVPGDTERAAFVAGHVQRVVQTLHHHHTAEDTHVWPQLLERAPEETAALVHLMESQHAEVAKHADEAVQALKAFAASPTVAARSDAAVSVEQFLPPLIEHLDTEEQKVVPLMERHITLAEWNRMTQQGVADVDPETIPLGFGMLLYEGFPDLVDAIIANMPAEVQPIIRELSAEAYAAQALKLYGTSTPPRSDELV